MNRLKETLKRGDIFHGETINYRKDKTPFWNQWHIEPIRDRHGKVTHYLAIQRDVTKQKQTKALIEQKNAALKELIAQIEYEKQTLKENIRSNVVKILLPMLKRLNRRDTRLDKQQLKILEKNLLDLCSSFSVSLTQPARCLSQREIEIANLIKNGLKTKEIAEMLHLSIKTVETHRNRIRRKLGLVHSKANMTSVLQNS